MNKIPLLVQHQETGDSYLFYAKNKITLIRKSENKILTQFKINQKHIEENLKEHRICEFELTFELERKLALLGLVMQRDKNSFSLDYREEIFIIIENINDYDIELEEKTILAKLLIVKKDKTNE
jgi:hypothetical protein